MAKKPGKFRSAGDRIRHLLAVQWRNNQTEMARAIGCSQASLSKILNRKIEPGKRMLAAISRHPGINPDWIFSGEGEPLKPYKELTSIPAELPISKQILGETPIDIQNVASVFSFKWPFQPSQSQYWLEIQRSDRICRSNEMRIKAGDLLLMETDRQRFPEIWDLFETLCAVQFHSGPQLGLVSYFQEDDSAELTADAFDQIAFRHEVITEQVTRTYPDGNTRTYQRYFKPCRSGGQTKREEITETQLEPIGRSVEYKDIVGVCVLVVRMIAI